MESTVEQPQRILGVFGLTNIYRAGPNIRSYGDLVAVLNEPGQEVVLTEPGFYTILTPAGKVYWRVGRHDKAEAVVRFEQTAEEGA